MEENVIPFSARHPVATTEAKARALAQLRALQRECQEPGWDGDEAPPLLAQAVAAAERFIDAWPLDTQLPEFAPEPDGALSLDWIASQDALFSLSIGASGRLVFAWVNGADRGSGVVNFDGEQIPRQIVGCVRDIVGYEQSAARRVA